MFLACLPIAAMATGLIVYVRALELSNGTGAGTIARLEARRAEESGMLLCILSSPWVALIAIMTP